MTIGAISIIIGVVLLILLKMFFSDSENINQNGQIHGVDHDELFKEDLDFDPSWAVLSSNTHHSEDD
ncbi:MAG: hypothetical protein KJ804_05955 [Proteobacteria bacterium]|nr:hypothetical protein [Pseudomonadota bacterium]MBU1057847.1 hypothetical protein [Pseudomonadota bacterium]